MARAGLILSTESTTKLCCFNSIKTYALARTCTDLSELKQVQPPLDIRSGDVLDSIR